ncbi:MAG: hypothetical protein IJX34_00205 [Clostridia bacterium]|nr:hypothetical protein [Clostridia bacterium]
MTNNVSLTDGVVNISQRELIPDDLAPNNYLTIIWKDVNIGNLIKHLDIDNKKAIEYSNQLSASIDNAISNNKVQYAGQNKYINLESIAKYVAQNSIDAGVQRTVINALIGVASGGAKKLPNNVTNLCLNMFGNIADKTARELGFTDPHNIFSQVAGQNVINVLGELGKQTKSFLDDKIKEINGSKKTNTVSSEGSGTNKKQYAGLLLGLTTSDTESYEITIPRKKIEDGSDYTTHLLPQPFKKEFSVKLTNKILSSDFNQLTEINAIEYTKDKLIEIAQSKTLFDIYIRLSADKIYKRSNVVFSSLSFTKDEGSGNSYTATFTIEPINGFKTKTFVSNKKYKTSGTGNSGSGGESNREQSNKTNDGKSIKIGYLQNNLTKTFSNAKEMNQYALDNDYYLFVSNLNEKIQFVHKDYVTDLPAGGYILKNDYFPNFLRNLLPPYRYDNLKSPFVKICKVNYRIYNPNVK